MKCFYHNDSDGKCAGFWVGLNVGLSNLNHPNDFIAMDYHKPFPINTILPDEQIYIVDYSIQPKEMDELLKITKDVTWIDHHKTAIEKYSDYPREIRGVRYDEIAGCMLTYCYIHKMTDRGSGDIKQFDISMTEDAPMFTKLIADWDVWKFDFGDDTRYFQTAFNSYEFIPGSREWDKFLRDNGNDGGLIAEGRVMTKFREGWAKSYCESKGFETIFEGYKCFALNLGNCNSEYFNSIDKKQYDILIPFSFNGENWLYSLYSTTIDVSEIAKKYGGGGHKGASGFTSDKLLLRRVDA